MIRIIMSDILNRHRPHRFITAGLISYLSMVYLFTKPLELLIRKLGIPKCVVTEIYWYSDIFANKRDLPVTIRWRGNFLVFFLK